MVLKGLIQWIENEHNNNKKKHGSHKAGCCFQKDFQYKNRSKHFHRIIKAKKKEHGQGAVTQEPGDLVALNRWSMIEGVSSCGFDCPEDKRPEKSEKNTGTGMEAPGVIKPVNSQAQDETQRQQQLPGSSNWEEYQKQGIDENIRKNGADMQQGKLFQDEDLDQQEQDEADEVPY